MSGAEIDLQLLVDDLETAVARATFFPVVPVCASTGVGTAELLEVMTSAFPAPPEHVFPAVYTTAGATVNGLGCDPEGPLLAEVVKTTSDPYVGRVSLVRVFSGTLLADATVHVSGHLSQFFGDDRGHADHDVDERIGALSCPLGKTQRVVGQSVAGDIVAVSKLSHAETGDSLSSKDQPLLMEPWAMPQPLLPVAVQAHAKADEDKLSQGLTRLAAEDSTLRIEHNGETHQLVLWCMGEAHADVVLDRLEHRYGVKVDPVELRVPLRETFIGSGRGHGRRSGPLWIRRRDEPVGRVVIRVHTVAGCATRPPFQAEPGRRRHGRLPLHEAAGGIAPADGIHDSPTDDAQRHGAAGRSKSAAVCPVGTRGIQPERVRDDRAATGLQDRGRGPGRLPCDGGAAGRRVDHFEADEIDRREALVGDLDELVRGRCAAGLDFRDDERGHRPGDRRRQDRRRSDDDPSGRPAGRDGDEQGERGPSRAPGVIHG